MPLPFDIVEGHFNRQFEELVSMNNFDDIHYPAKIKVFCKTIHDS